MASGRLMAGDEGAEAGNPVREAMLDEEIERAIGDGRLGGMAFGAQAFEHIIGPKGGVGFEEDFEHAAAGGGQAQTPLGADRIGLRQRAVAALRMVVTLEGRAF